MFVGWFGWSYCDFLGWNLQFHWSNCQLEKTILSVFTKQVLVTWHKRTEHSNPNWVARVLNITQVPWISHSPGWNSITIYLIIVLVHCSSNHFHWGHMRRGCTNDSPGRSSKRWRNVRTDLGKWWFTMVLVARKCLILRCLTMIETYYIEITLTKIMLLAVLVSSCWGVVGRNWKNHKYTLLSMGASSTNCIASGWRLGCP